MSIRAIFHPIQQRLIALYRGSKLFDDMSLLDIDDRKYFVDTLFNSQKIALECIEKKYDNLCSREAAIAKILSAYEIGIYYTINLYSRCLHRLPEDFIFSDFIKNIIARTLLYIIEESNGKIKYKILAKELGLLDLIESLHKQFQEIDFDEEKCDEIWKDIDKTENLSNWEYQYNSYVLSPFKGPQKTQMQLPKNTNSPELSSDLQDMRPKINKGQSNIDKQMESSLKKDDGADSRSKSLELQGATASSVGLPSPDVRSKTKKSKTKNDIKRLANSATAKKLSKGKQPMPKKYISSSNVIGGPSTSVLHNRGVTNTLQLLQDTALVLQNSTNENNGMEVE